MKLALLIISLLGWLTCLIIVISDYFGTRLFNLSIVWILNAGIFIVTFSAILMSRNNPRLMSSDDNDEGISLGPLLHNAPVWVIIILIITAIAIIHNYTKYNYQGSFELENSNGIYLLKRDGETKVISKSEYDILGIEVLNIYTGIWLLFYSAAVLIFSVLIKWQRIDAKKCINT